MQNLIYEEIELFQKEFKKLNKKFVSLMDDFKVFKITSLQLYHMNWIDNNGFFPIEWLWIDDESKNFLKVKKFACKALKWRWVKSWIRIIYCYHIDLDKITFLEIYHKNDKENCDYERIRKYYNNLINTPC